MKFQIIPFSLAAGILWGSAILLVASANMMYPAYGNAFLVLIGSIYPGYNPGNGFMSVIYGSLYAFVDGAIAAAIFAWIYNKLAKA